VARTAYFGSELFAFLKALPAHNNREWFHANKDRYDRDVKQPVLRFIADFEPRLKKISKCYVADARSAMRPNRDVRFSADKSPYKTMAGALFKHALGKTTPAPGFMLHLEPGHSFAGIGLRGPDPKTLKNVRDAIVADPKAWKQAISGKAFKTQCELTSESLSRPPRGYDPNHAFIEDLKRRHYCTITPFTEREASAPDFLDRYTEVCRLNAPLMAFLCKALKLSW